MAPLVLAQSTQKKSKQQQVWISKKKQNLPQAGQAAEELRWSHLHVVIFQIIGKWMELGKPNDTSLISIPWYYYKNPCYSKEWRGQFKTLCKRRSNDPSSFFEKKTIFSSKRKRESRSLSVSNIFQDVTYRRRTERQTVTYYWRRVVTRFGIVGWWWIRVRHCE